MKKILLSLLTFIIVILVVGLVGYGVLSYNLKKSVFDFNGEYNVKGITASTEVYFDSTGIPTIFATNDEDAAFALGYVHASERMFQMDLIRRVAQGRLSEIMGNRTIEYDKLFRTIGFRDLAEKNYAAASDETKKMFVAYSKGVNAYLKKNESTLPIEFDLLNYRPEQWKPVHSALMIRMLAWELNIAWFVDVMYAAVSEKLGEAKAGYLLPSPTNNQPLLPGVKDSSTAMLQGFIKTMHGLNNFLHTPGTQMGSNNWAVSPQRSSSGSSIIANDPHLNFLSPARWYIANIKSPNWEAAGFTIPGVPAVVIGKTKTVSWSITNLMADDADFYKEKLDNSLKFYELNGSQQALSIKRDTIRVKDGEPIPITIRSTHRGPIISDVVQTSRYKEKTFFSNTAVSMRWSGSEVSDDYLAFYRFNRATNIGEIQKACEHFHIPSMNLIVAEKNAIAYFAVGAIPIRPSINPFSLFDGSTTASDWQGFRKAHNDIRVLNPQSGYIATANYVPPGGEPYYISTVYAPASRFERITQLLEAKPKHSASDFMQYQNDVTSPLAKKIAKHITNAFSGIEVKDKNLKAVLHLLGKWDGNMGAEMQEPAIYAVILKHLLKNTYHDDLGNALYSELFFLANTAYKSLERSLNENDNPLFDDYRTPQRERKEDIIRKSVVDALDELEKQFGKNIYRWQWGKLHSVRFRHFFSGNSDIVDNFIDVGPFEIGGDGSTIFNTEYKLTDVLNMENKPEYEAVLGPSMRYVFDFATPDFYYVSLTSGQSGNIFSQHYSDITKYWLEGKTIRVFTETETVKSRAVGVLVLLPE